MVLAVAAGILLGQIRKPDESQAPSTAIVGTYTYVYDYAGVLTDETMAHIDAMNASLFAQTGAQLMVQTVSTTGGVEFCMAPHLGQEMALSSMGLPQFLQYAIVVPSIHRENCAGTHLVPSSYQREGGLSTDFVKKCRMGQRKNRPPAR